MPLRKNLKHFFRKFCEEWYTKKEVYETAYLQPNSVAGGDGIQNLKPC